MSSKNAQSTALILGGVLLLFVTLYSFQNRSSLVQLPALRSTESQPTYSANQPSQPSDPRLDAIANLARQVLRSEDRPTDEELSLLNEPSDGIYVALRASGIEAASVSTAAGRTGALIQVALDAMLEHLESTRPAEIDSVEICDSSNVRDILASDLPTNLDRGILGLKATYAGPTLTIWPTEMIAKNLSFDLALGRLAEGFEISVDELRTSGSLQVFDCEQLLVLLDTDLPAIPLFRGNQVVPVEAVDLQRTQEFARLASAWMMRQVQQDGRMLYLYFPSRGEESTANNMIRQFMATLALDRILAYSHDDSLTELTRKNILYNLANFYHAENGLGLIDYEGEVKLGAIALAALALHEHPNSDEFANEIESLAAGVDELWNEDGSFETFYRPESRSGQNQNFYPGEALLFWSVMYTEEQDPLLLSKIMQSFHYYREWHYANRNPAFIPWHTQAYYNVWKLTKDAELKTFIFEMNDWLLDFQEVERAAYGDAIGRFYDSGRPQYGPPHASADGVYLEGLVDAYLLASEVGDSQRQADYSRAIRYGLRSLMQLQFVDEIDMYYISRTEPVHGGLRTTVYDNAIRVDNVQHGLMAVLKILSNPEAQGIFE